MPWLSWCYPPFILVAALVVLLADVPRPLEGQVGDTARSAPRLQSVSVETGRTRDGRFLLEGRDAGQQLIVTGHFADGQMRDLTRQVQYETNPPGVVSVDASGYVSAL